MCKLRYCYNVFFPRCIILSYSLLGLPYVVTLFRKKYSKQSFKRIFIKYLSRNIYKNYFYLMWHLHKNPMYVKCVSRLYWNTRKSCDILVLLFKIHLVICIYQSNPLIIWFQNTDELNRRKWDRIIWVILYLNYI